MVFLGQPHYFKCTGIALYPPKTVHFAKELKPAYRTQNRTTHLLQALTVLVMAVAVSYDFFELSKDSQQFEFRDLPYRS